MKPIYVLIAITLLGCSDNIISVPAKNEIPAGYMQYAPYWLPKTALKIQVPVSHNALKKSIVSTADLAATKQIVLDYFGWEPVEEPKDEKFTLDQKIIFQPVTLRDPNKQFTIAYNTTKSIAETLNVSLSKDGLIQSGEFAQENKTFDVAKKSVELLATGIGALAGLGAADPPKKKFDTDVAAIKDTRVRNLIIAAKTLSDARLDLIGNPPTSVNTTDIIKAHLGEIDDQLKAIKALLCGSIKKSVYYVTLYIEPEKDFNEIKLLTLNETDGVVSKTGDVWSTLSAELIKGTEAKAKTLKLVGRKLFTEPAGPGKPVAANALPTSVDKSAFIYYNLPAKYELTLVYGKERIASYATKDQKEGTDDYQIYFPQLGGLAYLPTDFKEANIVYYEDTGSLKSAKHVKGATATPENIEGMYKAIDSLRTTIKAIKEKDSKKDEEETEKEVEEQVIRLIIQNEPAAGAGAGAGGAGGGGQQ